MASTDRPLRLTKDGKLLLDSEGKLADTKCCCGGGDCTPGNGLPPQGNSPPSSFDYPFTIQLQINVTASPTRSTGDNVPFSSCSPDGGTPAADISLTWNGQASTSASFDPDFIFHWDTDVDGDDWGNGDAGVWCGETAFGQTGQSDGYFSHPACPVVDSTGGDPGCEEIFTDPPYGAECHPCQQNNPLQSYFEISEVRYGTVNGNTGWHVVTFGVIFNAGALPICGLQFSTDFDYLNTFLGNTPEGTITRSLDGFTVEFVVSYS